MVMYLLYCALLAVWVLLLWPALRLGGRARGWLVLVIFVAIAALIHEIRMFLWVIAAIRLDIIVISAVLGVLYASAAVLLYARHWVRTAATLAVVLAAIGGGMGYQWLEVSREGRRASKAFEESNRLLFKAKFRDQETYESYFGPLTGDGVAYPSGHWQSEGRSRFTRVIVNDEGRVWLFYQCQEDAECHSGPGGTGLRKSGGDVLQWVASLKPPAGLLFDIEMARSGTDVLSVVTRGQTYRFTRVPPPVDPAPAARTLRFLGSYSDVECIRAHAKVRQVWLWQNGEHLYGIAIFSTLVAGQESRFVRPVVLGQGNREGDGWRFDWQQDGTSGTAMVVLKNGEAMLTLDQDLDQSGRTLEDADRLVLNAAGVFSDERIELAPLTSGIDWQHWFDNVTVGHFATGHVPPC